MTLWMRMSLPVRGVIPILRSSLEVVGGPWLEFSNNHGHMRTCTALSRSLSAECPWGCRLAVDSWTLYRRLAWLSVPVSCAICVRATVIFSLWSILQGQTSSPLLLLLCWFFLLWCLSYLHLLHLEPLSPQSLASMPRSHMLKCCRRLICRAVFEY